MLKSKNQLETNKYELEIEVSAEAFEEAVQKVYLKNKSKISVAGFRPGKAPRKIIEREYGEGVFYEDAINDLYPVAIEAAVKEADLTLVAPPEADVVSLSKEEGIVFKAVCITKPEVEIKDYKGIKVKKTVNAVTDEMVEHEVGHALERGARSVSVEGRPAQLGDETVIDFEGFKDGVAFEGGKGEGFTLKLGSNTFIPGFEDQIVGHEIGEEFDVNVTFPEQYQEPSLAGAPAVFKIKLHEIKETVLPELDDDFVKDTTDFETVEEFKADIKKNLEEIAEKNAEAEVEGAILDAVIAKVEGEIPEVMYENKVNEMIEDLSNRLGQQGIALDMYLQFTGMTMESLKTTYREQAEKQVKLRLAFEKIVVLEGLEATEEDIEAEFTKIGEMYGMPVETVKQYIRPEDIKLDVQVSKAADLVKNSAVVK